MNSMFGNPDLLSIYNIGQGFTLYIRGIYGELGGALLCLVIFVGYMHDYGFVRGSESRFPSKRI